MKSSLPKTLQRSDPELVELVPYVQVDGKLVTGQNPASSGPGAEELLKLLRSV